jgi:hypothetical protein
MSDNRQVAGQIMKEAWETISKKRPGVHGSAELSFEMIGDFWTIYLRHARKTRGNDTIRPEDVAEMMSMLKKARKMYGDPANIDNDVDDLGYTGLAAMLRLPDITLPKEGQVDKELDKLDLDNSDTTNNGHDHEFGDWTDDDGFSHCGVPGCTAKKQVRKPKNGKKTDATV